MPLSAGGQLSTVIDLRRIHGSWIRPRSAARSTQTLISRKVVFDLLHDHRPGGMPEISHGSSSAQRHLPAVAVPPAPKALRWRWLRQVQALQVAHGFGAGCTARASGKLG